MGPSPAELGATRLSDVGPIFRSRHQKIVAFTDRFTSVGSRPEASAPFYMDDCAESGSKRSAAQGHVPERSAKRSPSPARLESRAEGVTGLRAALQANTHQQQSNTAVLVVSEITKAEARDEVAAVGGASEENKKTPQRCA